MEDSLENWVSHLEMEDDIFNQSHNSSHENQEFIREILEQPNFSPESECPSLYHCSTIQNNNTTAIGIVEGGATSPTKSNLSFDETSSDHGNGTLHKSNSSNSIMSSERCGCSPSTYLLSFDNSSVEPIIHEPSPKHNSAFGTKKRTIGKEGFGFEPSLLQATKRIRRSSETKDHIIAERKRRQELTQNIIALSASIPGLKKMDKAYVLREAVNYTKQLQERVKELENHNKNKRVDSAIWIRKSQASSNKSTIDCETNSESQLEVEARVLEKEVLIGIHCEKQKDIVPKIHVLLEKLHLSITNSSVLPFGTSTLIINIIAQMDGEYSMSMDDLVKNLREDL
ncbi:transcription factor bHLH18-like [Gastrolobium bilobum]|uniref:transcription factor bHLH18-like n=1 Tax=Gastrolobium bilobum TaxID=150636 RepID=UPI002AAF27F5|nr:transcription factor bHLH18-like [Gastrolobium bilobum]